MSYACYGSTSALQTTSGNASSVACYEEGISTWVPCAFLCLLLPLEVQRIRSSPRKPIPPSFLNCFKIVLVILLACITSLELLWWLSSYFHNQLTYGSAVLNASIKLFNYIVACLLIWHQRAKGIHTSGVLLVFWFIMSLAAAVNYAAILTGRYLVTSTSDLKFYFVISSAYLSINVVQFLLSCFADVTAEHFHDLAHQKNKCPESSASFLSQITFWWFNSMIRLGSKQPLTQNDMWELDDENLTDFVSQKFKGQKYRSSSKYGDEHNNLLQKAEPETSHSTHRVSKSLVQTFWSPLAFSGVLILCSSVLKFVNPVILDYLISFISSTQPAWIGYVYGLVMFSCSILQSLVISQYDFRVAKIGMQVRSSLVSAIYEKGLKLSIGGQNDLSVGEVVNLMAVDSAKVVEFVQTINQLWSTPLQIFFALYLLWNQLGPAALAGLAVTLILIPVNSVITTKQRNYQVSVLRHKDKRIKLMNEFLTAIRVLKLFAWENFFASKVMDVRKEEVKELKKQAYVASASTFSFACAPIFVALASFATYVLIDEKNVLDANKAFVSLTLFNTLRVPLAFAPRLITAAVTAVVSLRRINRYLNSDEIDVDSIDRENGSPHSVYLQNASFSWTKQDDPILKNINVTVQRNKLVAIVGEVGSGKSSFFSAILGEMHKKSGYVNVSGKVAFVPQQAWIKNETFRQNILFTKPLNEERYRHILKACALEPDLEILPGGDLCEIGEKGINLSGGQKQRVSLARAAYFDADIYLLDDPLSAVDVHVSRQLFDEVIGPKGILKSKTRILVTHRLSVLPHVDEIIVMKNGQISEIGTYSALLANNGDFAYVMLQYLSKNKDDIENFEDAKVLDELKEKVARKLSSSSVGSIPSNISIGQTHKKDATTPVKTALSPSLQTRGRKSRLIEEEQSAVGAVKWSVYKQYLAAMGIWAFCLTLLCFAISSLLNVLTNLWLTAWSNDAAQPATGGTSQRNYRLGVYASLGISETVFVLTSTAALGQICISAADKLHTSMMTRIVFAPMYYFDTTPVGRILNRFSRDVDIADSTISNNVRMLVNTIRRAIVSVLLVSAETPLVILIIVPITVLYIIIQRYYVATSRQLQRIESVTRSPIFTHFSETLVGSTSVRAFNVSDVFLSECHQRVDNNHRSYYANAVAARWLATRVEFLGFSIVLISAIFAVSLRGAISPAIAGLSLSYALSLSQNLGMLVRSSSAVETNIVAIERCLEYNKIPAESPQIIEYRRPDPKWPQNGKIEFVNYNTRYRTGSQLVLENINCTINPREKIGVVGRTGAGKSTFSLSLFRMLEPAQGTIMIDNVDITTIGLHDLRSRLTVIPQDPVLFTGTLRRNLDPTEELTDEALWKALELVLLKDFVSSLGSGLSHQIVEGGENLSVGQRQLLCLARAILRSSKILVLDEATAAVDPETDEQIQKTIRTQFKDCTVITIAHRLNTVIDYDKVLVLSVGRIVEFDTPKNLIENKNSMFYGMLQDAAIA